ncbi:MAG: hypothetical protein WCF03_09775 [Nitrososphaeraceae archaeon]
MTIKSESRLKTQVEEISQVVREHDALNKDAIAMLSGQSDRVKKRLQKTVIYYKFEWY